MNNSSHRNHSYRHLVFIIFALFSFFVMLPVLGNEENSSSRLSSTERATYKTITFQSAANISDTLIFGTIVGTTATTGALFFVANTASAMMLYFPYELAWDKFGPSPETTTEKTIAIKTTVYQAITAVRNLALGYVFSGALRESVGFMSATIAIDSLIYVANEYIWDIFSPRSELRNVTAMRE